MLLPVIQSSIEDFINTLNRNGIRRCFFVHDKAAGKVRASHPALEPIARWMEGEQRDFQEHEGVFLQVSPSDGVLQGAFVHRTCRGQAQGGTRLWDYPSLEAYLRDGLRLSWGMTRKNALAGLWWGGGKGVIARNSNRVSSLKDPQVRARVFQEYGDFMTSLNGCYITAEDVGTTTADMAQIFSRTRFITCIPEEMGGSGNPSAATAAGVVRGMEAAIHNLEGSRASLRGRRVAVQGAGNVARFLVQLLIDRGVKSVVASEISEEAVGLARQQFAGAPVEIRGTQAGDATILAEDCDVLAPCATGGILNPRTIPTLRARIVCGAANNQLEDPERDGELLRAQGITYVPDFLVNRMGIVNCANEQYGRMSGDPLLERHLGTDWSQSVYRMTERVLALAQERSESTDRAATRLADELSLELHPIWGHRGIQIIDSLVRSGWDR